MKFGDYIREQREALGWTQPEAARRAEIEQSYLSKLENGKNYPAEDVFEKLVDLYKLDIPALGRSVPAEELQNLRQISAVRTLINGRETTQRQALRAWLLSGLIMVMAGTGLLTYDLSGKPQESATYRYESQGVIKNDEPDDYYTSLAAIQKLRTELQVRLSKAQNQSVPAPMLDQQKDIDKRLRRLDLQSQSHNVNKGAFFVSKEEGGRRIFRLKGSSMSTDLALNPLWVALGCALIIGGLGCFFLSNRWR